MASELDKRRGLQINDIIRWALWLGFHLNVDRTDEAGWTQGLLGGWPVDDPRASLLLWQGGIVDKTVEPRAGDLDANVVASPADVSGDVGRIRGCPQCVGNMAVHADDGNLLNTT